MAKQEFKIGLWLEFAGKALTEGSQELLALAHTLAKELQQVFPQQTLLLEGFLHHSQKIAPATLGALPVNRVHHSPKPHLAKTLAEGIFQVLPDFNLFLTPMSLEGRELGSYLGNLCNAHYLGAVKNLQVQNNTLQITCFADFGVNQKTTCLAFSAPLVLGISPLAWGGRMQELLGEASPALVKNWLENASNQGASVWAEVEAGLQEYQAPQAEILVEEGGLVVAGGLGMGDEAGFALLEALGKALGAPVGGSRVAQDQGWINSPAMIGATGKALNAGLYLAFGISGAVQHLVGIENCGKIIAINTDPLCALMQQADLAVVGDSKQIISALLEEVKSNPSPKSNP